MNGPTFGRPGGEHRVLEPPGAEPLTATRLDALAELWDGEARLELEALVLPVVDHRSWVARLSSDPGVLAAAVAEAVAERGGLGPEAANATLVGTIAHVAAGHPGTLAPGERVAVALPAGAVPLFAAPTVRWDGGRVVPMAGHAVLPAAAPTVPVGDAAPALAAVLAGVADVPALLAAGDRVVVVGLEEPAGAVALAALAAEGRHVTAVVRSLAVARLARALGASRTTVADPRDPIASADHVREVAADEAGAGGTDLVVLADPAGAALAARLAAAVQVLVDPQLDAGVVARLVTHARAVGRGVAVHAGRGPVSDRGVAVRDLVASGDVLLLALRWQAGLGPLPTAGPDPEDP